MSRYKYIVLTGQGLKIPSIPSYSPRANQPDKWLNYRGLVFWIESYTCTDCYYCIYSPCDCDLGFNFMLTIDIRASFQFYVNNWFQFFTISNMQSYIRNGRRDNSYNKNTIFVKILYKYIRSRFVCEIENLRNESQSFIGFGMKTKGNTLNLINKMPK